MTGPLDNETFGDQPPDKVEQQSLKGRGVIAHAIQDSLRAAVSATVLLCAGAGIARADSTITIATVNNGDMVVMQRLSSEFEKQHPDIHLRWVVLEENVLRQRVTTDIATKAGQFDILTIGNYEVPIWAKQGWLEPMDNLPASYDVDDLLKPVRDGLTYKGKLYGLPFYGESAMTYYRTDLFQKAGIKMPDAPTYRARSAVSPTRSPTRRTRSTACACAASPAGARTWPTSPHW